MLSDMGGGHRSTANALQKLIEKRQLPWEVCIVELLREILGKTTSQNVYNNLILKNRWIRFIHEPLLAPYFRLEIRLSSSAWIKQLKSYWYQHKPDIVVSVNPNVNRILYESLQAALPSVPFVTLMGDLADSPPNFWIEPQQKQFLICPTEKAVEQAKKFGYKEEQIFRTSGVVINPQFYEPITVDRRIERQRLGLDPDLPTGIVMFGGQGSNVMLEIAQCLEQSSLKIQLIFICGRNEKLADILRRSQSRSPRFVETFTIKIPYYMYLSDFFIGKPGPGSISEALTMNLPVIVECNASTLFQEKYNAEWIVNQGVGIVVRNFRHIDRAVTELIKPEKFARYRANVEAFNNQSVFEVVNILDKILEYPCLGDNQKSLFTKPG